MEKVYLRVDQRPDTFDTRVWALRYRDGKSYILEGEFKWVERQASHALPDPTLILPYETETNAAVDTVKGEALVKQKHDDKTAHIESLERIVTRLLNTPLQ